MSVDTLEIREAADFDVTTPELYGDEEGMHRTFARMRKEAPVVWLEPEGFRPFWALTKHADIIEIEKLNNQFLNGPRAILLDEEFEQVPPEEGGPGLVRTLVHMDEPDHSKFRGLTQSWFQPGNLRKHEPRFREIAKAHVDKMVELGSECDFARDIAMWYPLRIIMSILGVPEEDEPRMLKLTQDLFGGNDPEQGREDEEGDPNVILDFYEYFTSITEDRRKNPKEDVASVIANATVDGELIGHLEAMSYYIIVATAGHDTTSSSTAGGMHALATNPGELEKLKKNPLLTRSAVEEMIRWVTPVKHFMRTATEDYELRGETIRADESVMMFYPSANRDEDVFEDPYSFKVDRSPNRHVSFGYAAHFCLGAHLARLEMKLLYEELIPRLNEIELNGDPEWVQTNFVGGLKHLPVKYSVS